MPSGRDNFRRNRVAPNCSSILPLSPILLLRVEEGELDL
jgi:hypothetical protein